MNFAKLQHALYEHGKVAILHARALRPNDTFYSFAFYTSEEFAYAFMTAASHEGLDEVVTAYLQKPQYANQSLVKLRQSLKWSPCDSPLHGLYELISEELDHIMSEVSEAYLAIDDDRKSGRFADEIEASFLNALQQLDSEGLMGTSEQRNGLVLNMLMGDQSDEDRLRLASFVNPPAVVVAFAADLSLGYGN